MEIDKAADTDSELSTKQSEYCSEPESDDDRIHTGMHMDEHKSQRSLSREEFDSADNQSIVSDTLGPIMTEKIACSTLVQMPDKAESEPVPIPAPIPEPVPIPAPPSRPSQSHILQKDICAEIIQKLDKILENQVVILFQLQIGSKPDAVETPKVDEIASRQSPPPPLPQLKPTPAIQLQSATNINPVVNDAILAKTLRLKPKSSSAGNLATKLVRVLFQPEELINRNCSGSRGKEKLDEEKLKKLITYVCNAYGVLTEEQTKITGRECRLAIEELLRPGNRARAKERVIR